MRALTYILALALPLFAGCRGPQPQPPSISLQPVPETASLQNSISVRSHFLPDPTLTPGAIFQNVSSTEICKPGYAKSVRNVPAAEKVEVYKEYGLQPNVSPCPCEVDHLVSLELGGSNDKSNLWPQPYTGQWNARQKDKLENFLHQQVCEGKISLQDAQMMIATNWIKAYVDFGLSNP